MRPAALCGVALIIIAPVFGVDHALTATKERLWAMEPLIQEAVEYYGKPVTLLPSGERSRFRIFLLPKFQSRESLTLYQKSTGRRDCTRLEFWDTEEKRVVVSLDFPMSSDELVRRRAAFQFIEKVKQHLATP